MAFIILGACDASSASLAHTSSSSGTPPSKTPDGTPLLDASTTPSDPKTTDGGAEVDGTVPPAPEPDAATKVVGPDYVFKPCKQTGPECPCPSGTRWPWPSWFPEPATPELYCTPDGQVASQEVAKSERVPVTCASVCLGFSLSYQGHDSHGLCDQFGEDFQNCIDECHKEWTPEQICCRAERVSSQRQSTGGTGQVGVPGFPSCGSAAVDSHYSCGQLRRPQDPFFLEHYAACGVMGGRRY